MFIVYTLQKYSVHLQDQNEVLLYTVELKFMC